MCHDVILYYASFKCGVCLFLQLTQSYIQSMQTYQQNGIDMMKSATDASIVPPELHDVDDELVGIVLQLNIFVSQIYCPVTFFVSIIFANFQWNRLLQLAHRMNLLTWRKNTIIGIMRPIKQRHMFPQKQPVPLSILQHLRPLIHITRTKNNLIIRRKKTTMTVILRYLNYQ